MNEKAHGETKKVKWPSLTERERDRRWERVRQMMKAEGIDVLVVFGLKGREQYDLYLTNDRTGGIVIFPQDGELVHLTWTGFDVVSHLESSLRGEASWVRDMRPDATGRGVVEILQEKRYDRAAIGVVGLDTYAPGEREGYVPYNTWAYILKNLPHADFREVSLVFADLVSVKSDEELQLVRRAAEIGELAARTMIKKTRPGVSESEIYSATISQLFKNGANGTTSPYITPMILHSGPDNPSWGAPMWLLRGQRPRVIKSGDLVQAEIFSRYGSLEAQLQVSIAVGPVDAAIRECAAIARRSYEIGLEALVPGKRFGDIVEAMGEPLRQAGAWHLTPLIHSLSPLTCIGSTAVRTEGLPGIDAYKKLRPTPIIGADVVVREGTVWALEPNACLGKRRVNIGGTVVVTKKGTASLNLLPTEMRVVG